MTTNPAALEVRLDDHGGLAEDIACRKCGYNLRGLRTEGVCPECGTAVGRSLYGDFLRYCDPAWVKTLAKGMNWILAGIIIGVVTGCTGGAGTAFGSMRFARTPDLTAWAIALPGTLVALIGYWLVTTRDPAHSDKEKVLSARRLVRVAQIVGLLAGPALLLIRSISITFAMGLGAVGSIVSLGGTIAIFVLARDLALRIPDEKLARSTRGLMWVVTVVIGLSFVFGVIGAVVMSTMVAGRAATPSRSVPINYSPSSAPSGAPALTSVTVTTKGITTSAPAGTPFLPTATAGFLAFAVAVGVVSIVCLIWGIRLFGAYRRAFLEQAAAAERIWASSATAPPIARPSAGA